MTIRCLVAIALFIAGCQTQPTKISETQIREFDLLLDKSSKPIELTDKTVVLDTRSSFDYGLNRVANSIHFPYENLLENPAGGTGEVLRDRHKAAQRLALLGLDPKSPVVIVGLGPAAGGKGETGRVAWNLLLLGFHDVQVGNIEIFRKNWTQNPTPPPQNAKLWTVDERKNLLVGPAEFQRLIEDPKGRMEKRIFILDVRSAREYLNKQKVNGRAAPDINAMNVEWTEFYTAEGRPDRHIVEKLKAVGIQMNDRVILISQKGVRSGAAAYALLALGFKNVQNFSAGWNYLLKN